MYAIIRTGGHQEKVSVGEVITVDRLKQDPESTVTFVPLMISDPDGAVTTDRKELGDKGAVIGRVLEHVRGDKIDVFQYRNKTGYRRHTGHRSALTLVEISEIRFGEKKVTLDDAKASQEKDAADKAEALKVAQEAKAKAKEDRATARSEKKAAAKKAAKKKPAKKTAAKKTAAKKTAAKKTAAKKN